MRCRNGRESREILPLWKRSGGTMPRREPVARGQQKMRCRNGRELREMLPLWKRDGGTMRHKWPVARVRRKKIFRNGRESQVTGFAAVVEKERKDNAAQKAHREGAAEKAVPQRQRIAGNAAVVEKERKDNAAQKACREGAQKRRCRNGRESQETLPLWKRSGGTMPLRRPVERVRQKSAVPQRQ